MTTEFDDDQVIDHEDLIKNHNRIRKRRKWFDNYPANLRKWSGERKWRPSQFASEQEGRKEGRKEQGMLPGLGGACLSLTNRKIFGYITV
jgi:hypothetical protein